MSKKIVLLIIFLSLAGLLLFLFVFNKDAEDASKSGANINFEDISNFEECVNAGYPVMESYPRQCSPSHSKTFVEEIELEGEDSEKYYGSSTYEVCESDEDCMSSGCNGEICTGVGAEEVASICVVPEEPLPKDLGYSCGCIENKCQWGRD